MPVIEGYDPLIMLKAIDNSPYIGVKLANKIILQNESAGELYVPKLDEIKGLGRKKRADLLLQYHKLITWGW